MSMLAAEQNVGDYFEDKDCSLEISPMVRRSMVDLIEQLTGLMSRPLENLFVATNIADRFLAIQAIYGRSVPSLIELAIVAVMLARKLNINRKEPTYEYYREIVNDWDIKSIDRADLLALEYRVIKDLEFNVSCEVPSNFLDRFELLFKVVIAHINRTAQHGGQSSSQRQRTCIVRSTADFLCTLMLRDTAFLVFRPSQMAAVAMIAALNSLQQIIIRLGMDSRALTGPTFWNNLDSAATFQLLLQNVPLPMQLKYWNRKVQRVTGIDGLTDLQVPYSQLLNMLKSQNTAPEASPPIITSQFETPQQNKTRVTDMSSELAEEQTTTI